MKNAESKRRKHKEKVPAWIEMGRKTNEPAPLNKQWSVEERESVLDYLYGDIANDAVKACCYYEYARASETLRRARREFDQSDPRDLSVTVSNYFPGWILNADRLCFLQCKDFPQSAWRDLTKEDRANFQSLFKPISHRPIITDVRKLDALRVFDQFKQQAKNEAANDKIFDGFAPPVVGDGPIRHVVFTIDYRDGVDAVTKQIARWLDSEASKELFKHYYKKPIHKQNPDSPDRYRELLKFLAAWRLYDELGPKDAKRWTRKNRREYAGLLQLRAFFREKGKRLNTKPLYEDRREWEDARDNAEAFLVTEIEYGQSRAQVS